MPSPAPPKATVSYAWKEERGGDNASAVETFCEQLRAAGVTVVRDIDRLKQGECISTFMRSIGASDFLCVFLSDAYLKSPNCMYELLVAWQRSKDNPDEFRSRVKVWVMPGADSIYDIAGRQAWRKHWMAERDRMAPLVREGVTEGLADAEVKIFNRIKEFAEKVNEMLCFFADTLSPGSAEEFQKWILEHFPAAMPRVTEEQLAEVYENTIEEIEGVLNLHQSLRQFLSTATTGLIQEQAEGWKLAPAVRSRAFDVSPHLEKIAKRLDSFNGQAGGWKALGEVAGGLVVLGINREWVLGQKELARLNSAKFPADDEAISLGGGRRANLLHLVTCALADGRARLDKVFGKPPLDEYRLADGAHLERGIGEPDHERGLKLHIIRCVLGPDTPVDEANASQIEILFKRAKDVISAAFHDDHTPFVGTGDFYKNRTAFIRERLKIEDLLLIHPSGEDPEALLTDNVRVLRFLGKIFDAVQAHTAR